MTRRWDALVALVAGLAARLAAAHWAGARFPAAEDGRYYATLAARLATGHGYTWLWPDGAVTHAAHYPVGYPAMLAGAYALFGASTGVAMVLNAVVGATAAWGAHAMVDGPGVPRWRPLAAGLAVALHPALVAYTPAVMTEGVTAALLALAAGLAARARASSNGRRTAASAAWLALLGLTLGAAVLVRPQSLLFAPVLGALAWGGDASAGASHGTARLARAAAVTLLALAVVAPWTARNCVRMRSCALVSVNGGTNLLIGVRSAHGGWAPVEVPPECATVWDEAGKDACFGAAARRAIAADPLGWIERMPGKLAATLDYFGAAPWYLHASNADAFDDADKWRLGVVETVAARLLLLAALLALVRLDALRAVPAVLSGRLRAGPPELAPTLAALAGLPAAASHHAWLAYLALGLALALALRAAGGLARAPVVFPATLAAVLVTAAVHAAFFGAGRYGLVVVPFVTALAFARLDLATPVPPEATASRAISASSAVPSLSAAERS